MTEILKCSICGVELIECDACGSIFHKSDDILHIANDEHNCMSEEDELEEIGQKYEEAQAVKSG